MDQKIIDGVLKHVHYIGDIRTTEILDFYEGYSKLRYVLTQDSVNIHGFMHGGVIFTLCDIAAAIATFSYGCANVTQNSSINYLQPIPVGEIFIEAKTIHKGKSTAVNEVKLVDQAGKIYTTATFCMFLVPELT